MKTAEESREAFDTAMLLEPWQPCRIKLILARDIEVMEEAAAMQCYGCRRNIPVEYDGHAYRWHVEAGEKPKQCKAETIHSELIAELRKQMEAIKGGTK